MRITNTARQEEGGGREGEIFEGRYSRFHRLRAQAFGLQSKRRKDERDRVDTREEAKNALRNVIKSETI